MKDELWIKKIKERLDNYSEPIPTSGWKVLEEELSKKSPLSIATPPQKRFFLRNWGMVAAATLLVAISSISLWLLQTPIIEDVRILAEPALAAIPDELPQQANLSLQNPPTQSVIKKEKSAYSSSQTLVAQQQPLQVTNQLIKDENMLIIEEVNSRIDTQTGKVIQAKESESPSKEEQTPIISRPSSKDKLHLPTDKKASNKKERWAMGVSVGNSPTFNTMSEADLILNPGEFGQGGKLDLSSTANGILLIPEGQEIIFKDDGLPYLVVNDSRRIRNISHKQPINFGISIRKGLAKGFSVESGIIYSLLSSDIVFEGSVDKMSQKLHYLGIPVRANWSFIEKNRFSMYVTAGGTVERCIYGKIGGEKETINDLQFSINGAIGAQYNISNKIGFYVEPGVSYFFDDGSSVETIRKDTPCNFNLQAGLRFTY